MITLPLSIRYQPQRHHATAAWWLPGSDPATWLNELLQWGVSLETFQVYPLPTSADDGTIAGVLVVPQDNPSAEVSALFVSPTTLPYGVMAGRLFLPVHATLQPRIEDDELAGLFSSDVVAYVFHPTIGLVGCDETSVLRVRDLLSAPVSLGRDWDAARPGIKMNERLLSIELADPPSVAAIIGGGQEDIGTESSSIRQLPPSPNEPRSGAINNLGRHVMEGVARTVLWLTSLAKKNASKPTWVDSVQSWASSKLAGVGRAIDSIRNKEILRLLDLLESNPDEGLRYAIPLDGPAHRGSASPTNHLARRPVDFSLSRLGGGLAGDFWQIERRYHERLRQSYRELAAREVNLGRHRRAAYIYAELLHDLNAAATTLKDGGHHREAAVLYRDRLHCPLEAAQCLEDGGLFGEAISLFRELHEYERAGDLHQRIEQFEEAGDAYRMAADAHATSGDRLAAARILEDKMGLPDQAIEALQAGWPNSHQAGHCLQALFELLARTGRHEMARDRVKELRDEHYSIGRAQLAAATMAKTATSYPSDEVRALAADSCRVVVGRSLPHAELSHQRQLLQLITQLASEDRLLHRDCSRFGQRAASPVRPRTTAIRPGRHAEPTLVAEFALPGNVRWQTIAAANELFYAAGFQGNSLSVVRGDWTGNVQSPQEPPWPVNPVSVASHNRIILAPPVGDSAAVWVHCHAIVKVPPLVFVPTDRLPKRATAVCVPGDRSRVVAAARGPSGVGWVLSFERDGACLVAYSPDGLLIRSVPLSLMELDEWDWLHVSHEAVYVAGGIGLLRVDNQGDQSTDRFRARIQSLTGTMPHTRTRLAVSFQQGGYVLWPSTRGDAAALAFGQDLSDFEMCFTKSGALVAISASGGEIYRTHEGRVALMATLPATGETPLAVVPTYHMNQFAVCMPSGVVRIYRLP